jgi:hypothetical protein
MRTGVRIEAEGPFGAIEPLEYVISVDDLRGSRAAPSGNLHAVAAELHEMTKATKELNEIVRNASLEPAWQSSAPGNLVVVVHQERSGDRKPLMRLLCPEP